MGFGPVVFGPKLAEGKTKIIFAHPEKDDAIYMVHKDGLTAGDGARRNTLPGKGALACRTTSNVFYLLEEEGIQTHYIGMVGDNINLMTRCTMIPLEVVMRRIATGSYLPEEWSETYATADVISYGGVPRVKIGREFLFPQRPKAAE